MNPYLKGEDYSWRRKVLYLVAGLWAAHWRKGRSGTPIPIGKACQLLYINKDKSPSIEHRFISLLDADQDQLPHRLRQIIALLKEQAIDFENLLRSLLYWNDEQKCAQNTWARDFYRNMKNEMETEPTSLEEQIV